MSAFKLNSVEELITDIRAGKMVILMDDEDRENEGDLVMAASHVRPEDINFMITHARGLVCLTLTPDRCKQLDLPLMVSQNGTSFGTNFTLSIEAAQGVETGISAADRARTVQAAVSPMAKPTDIVKPGHIFPLMAQPGGVLTRAGHTEAGCDLARLAGMEPASVIVEITKEDGSMARRPDLEAFAQKHNLKIGTIADLIHYRIVNEETVQLVAQQPLQTQHGLFNLYTFSEIGSPNTHIALTKGDVLAHTPCVRVHAFSPLRDLLDAKYDSAPSWSSHAVLSFLAKQPSGVMVWVNHDNTIDFAEALHAFNNREGKTTTHEYRSIGVGAQILRYLGVRQMRLMSSPMRFNALSGFDIEVLEYLPAVNPH